MSIKLTLLKSGETLISETKELVSEEDQTSPHAYLVTHPHIVKITEKVFMTEEQKAKGDFGIDVTLTPWIILTVDNDIIIPTNWVVTIVEPMESLKQMYIDKSKTFKVTEEEVTDGD
tara:strand:- start:272 stop:622 length:351 start_codon:yes stop_codon:yes gene_type:complete